MAKYLKGHGNRLNIPANVITAAVKSGDLYIQSEVVGVLLKDGAANAANVLQIEGVWTGPKKTGASSGGTLGKKAYVVDDGGTLKFTADNTGATPAGIHAVASADGDTTATVKLAGVAAVA